MSNQAVLSARDLKRDYEVGGSAFSKPKLLRALAGASFDLFPGKTLAVVGESGCGKSTLGRLVTMIEKPTSGTLTLDGKDVVAGLSNKAEAKQLRQDVQIVFQDPYGSLNPRHKIGSMLEEPLKINRPDLSAKDREELGRQMMAKVGLRPEHYSRYPHMFSGGQRQRIAIARALMLQPKVIVLDEPVSALDVSIQAQVLNLLNDVQEEFKLAYLFISHDLSVVKHVADEVMVMYLGRPVEKGSCEEIFANPQHPYTRALLSATPVADPRHKRDRIRLTGEIPSPIAPPPGCTFHPRCPLANERCRAEIPELLDRGGTLIACHAVEEGRNQEAAPAA
ncbi:dipeptide ABC transporter ATP-binding protein [Rhodospirillaceae bacterium KN72]|uniref:Dipeptide ABC transporter ATP-binding protein n=1 Tax=Pacificispira spongiicola TaxID=2729598 RepID=A0A7Y0HF33_9PROT|nr:dipeptide ABC transporter ATP-binding protein [Pacificispira spongiicola]NMM44168.1 dipeptide ABC transporter ATP-binding protein [Pacificispira spongiicola]